MREIWSKFAATTKKQLVGVPILALCIGTVIGVVIGEPLKIWLTSYLSSKELVYEVLSISKISKDELLDLARAEGLESMNLHLDDPVLADFWFLKARLKNDGTAIDRHLNFNVSIERPYTKLLDMKHKVVAPRANSCKPTTIILYRRGHPSKIRPKCLHHPSQTTA